MAKVTLLKSDKVTIELRESGQESVLLKTISRREGGKKRETKRGVIGRKKGERKMIGKRKGGGKGE